MRNFCEKVWGVMLPIDCFAILLVIDSMMGFVFLCSSLWWVGELYLSHENTCSEYRIRPQNTPRKFEFGERGFIEIENKHNKSSISQIRTFWGNFGSECGTPPPTPRRTPFFPDFSWFFVIFLDFSYISQRKLPSGGV